MYFITSRMAGAASREAQGLRRALDRVYARVRERARAEWELHHSGREPSDACVSVRVSGKGCGSAAS